MRGLFISVLASAYLYGASEPQSILSEVAKLRQKYEECRQGQSAVLGIEPKLYQQCETERKESTLKLKGYQSRIANLETQIQENNTALVRLQTQNRDRTRELSQKQGVVKSLEQTLTARDQKYREAAAKNELLSQNVNTVKVSKIERESLKKALASAKEESDRLRRELNKTLSAYPAADARVKLIAMQNELTKAQTTITRLQSAPSQTVIPEKVVYKDRPVIQEKIVTKVVEPTEKIKSLQSELAAAQTIIANLKNAAGAKVVYKDRIVTQEKVVYKDRPVVQEKIVSKVVEPTEKINALQTELATAQTTIANLKKTPSKVVVREKIVPQEKVVYKDRIVTQEKVVYKERPVIQEKIVTKVVEPTEKIKALQTELATAQTTIANLKNAPSKVVVREKIVPQEKVVYKDRIVTQEKVVYKDRPVIQEKIVTKIVEPIEKIKALQTELATAQTTIATLKNAPAKVVVKEKIVPQQKVVAKVDDAARRQMDKLALERERQKSAALKPAVLPAAPQPKPVAAVAPVAPKVTKIAAKSVVVPPVIKKASAPTEIKPVAVAATKKVSVPAETKPVAAVTATKKVGASAYRMAANAPIYTAPGGAQVDTWEARRSFTSGTANNGWIKITGYFVNRVWQKADEDLWVKESDVIKR